MRRLLLLALGALSALLVGPVAPALAHPGVALDPTLPTDLTYAATDNVEYLGRFPEHTGTAGGVLAPDGEVFLLTDPRGVLRLRRHRPRGADAARVDRRCTRAGPGWRWRRRTPNTNGSILLVDAAPTPYGAAQLQVVDVSDPRRCRSSRRWTSPTTRGSCVSGHRRHAAA